MRLSEQYHPTESIGQILFSGIVSILSTPIILAVCLLIFWSFFYGLYFALGALYLSWPIWFLLLTSYYGWRFAKKKETALGKAGEKVLLSVMLGLGALWLLQLIFFAFQRTFDANRVRVVETGLIHAHDLLESLSVRLNIVTTTILIVTLLALGRVYPRWQPVKQFVFVKDLLSRTTIALFTVCAFTFFSQTPLNDVAVNSYEEKLEYYRSLIKETDQSIGRYLAASALQRNLNTLDQATKQRLQLEFAIVTRELSGREGHSTQLVRDFANSDAFAVIRNNKRTGTEKVTDEGDIAKFGPQPSSDEERRKQQQLTEEVEGGRDAWATKADEQVSAASEIFESILDATTPTLRGLAGMYVKELISDLASRYFEDYARDYQRTGEQIELPSIEISHSQSLARLKDANELGFSREVNRTIRNIEVQEETRRLEEIRRTREVDHPIEVP